MQELTKYLIAIPTMSTMATPFVASLTYMNRVGASKVSFLSNSLVYDARNLLAAEAIDTGVDRVLWLDSDMCFDVDLMQRLAEDMDGGHDFVCGLYFRRVFPVVPIISKEVVKDGKKWLEVYKDYPKEQLFEVAACGFGACMMTTRMLKDVWDKFGAPFYPANGHGEDYAFCERAKALGYKLYCDSRIQVGHIGTTIIGEDQFFERGGSGDGKSRCATADE